jgi:outer membrane receptor protein involved in Fe transport
MKRRFLLRISFSCLLLVLWLIIALAGTTGKIAGKIVDKSTGEPVVGVNVVVVGTTLGAATDVNGEFTILFVPPGKYSVQISNIGYKKVLVSDVRVYIDQTVRVDVKMEVEAIEMSETVILAERPVKPDVATSVVAVSDQEINDLPVANMQSVVGLQAGVTGNLQIRGGDPGDALFQVNGITLRDPRNNQPISSIPLSSVKEVSVERGGFNAEYGQVRSGIVNVVTKEGGKAAYTASATARYSPYARKSMGISPFDKDSYWLRPYLDPAVCWTGTANGFWDTYTRAQYPNFNGWNALSQQLNTDNNPYNDLSPEALQKLFLFQTRKRPVISPDYTIDAGFGGPVPLVGENLGDLRFFTSYRRSDEMLLVPMTRNDNLNWDWNLRINSDPTKSIKVEAAVLSGRQYSQATNWSLGAYINTPNDVAGQIQGFGSSALFSNGYYSPAVIDYTSISAHLTHFLSTSTYYEVKLDRIVRTYSVTEPVARDTTARYEIVPGYFVDEAPIGYSPIQSSSYTGLQFGGASAKARDNSVVSATAVKADITSQIDFSNMLKAGVEFVYNDLNLNYGQVASLSNGTGWDNHIVLRVFPIRAGLYVQDKLETKGFVANLGVRVDYSNSQAAWFAGSPYDKAFFSAAYNSAGTYPLEKSKPQWQISPRLGISHPVTEDSKLYFNYGHFKEMPSYQQIFTVDRASSRTMNNFGNPDLILAKTVAYELGYDHYLGDGFLVQLAAFYRDITHNQDAVTYYSISNWSYSETASTGYADVRGFEITLHKSQGGFWNGFINYTYQSSSSGHFGSLRQYEDPTAQSTWDQNTTNLYQNISIPSPYARASINVFTPDDFGPHGGSFYPLSGFMLNVLLNWQAGAWTTYNPLGVSGISNNVKNADYFNTQLRISKSFQLRTMDIEVFADIFNALNFKQMNMGSSFSNSDDQNAYFSSLHLPKSNAYNNIPGDDRIGNYRPNGVAYQPVIFVGFVDATSKGTSGVIYFDNSSGRYMEFANGAWAQVDQSRIDTINKNKAYIDMPNLTSFTFLNPRQMYFGIRLSFKI